MRRSIAIAALGLLALVVLTFQGGYKVTGDPSWTRWRIEINIPHVEFKGRAKIWAPIPRSWDEQRDVAIITITPNPNDLYQDGTFGNQIAYWRRNVNNASSISLTFDISLLRQEWLIDPNNIGEYDLDDPEIQLYLSPNTHIQSDHPEIIQTAVRIIDGEANPYRKAKKILDFVCHYGIWGDRPNADALSALRTHRGQCEAYSFLFVALARAANIPARPVSGIANLTPGRSTSVSGGPNGENGYHIWSEFYLPNYGWIPVDATPRCLLGTLSGDRIALSKGTDIDVGHGGPILSFFHIPIISMDALGDRWFQLGKYFEMVVSRIEP